MKKWRPWLIALVIILLLIVRLFYRHVGGVKDERAWYISQLHYDFSARVDSVIRPGRVLVHVTRGKADPDQEWALKDQLHFNGMLHLLISRDGQFDILTPVECLVNDSLYINSDHDRLLVFRNHELIINRPLSSSLRGKPFNF